MKHYLRRALALLAAVASTAGLISAWAVLALRQPRFVLGSYSTDLSPRTPAQLQNIRIAAEAVDGVQLGPGEVFSFNAAAGPYASSRGYVPAPAIVGGEVSAAPGGGVCQVSSTLYNAVLIAGLQVVERHAHSRPPASVPPGRDATVSGAVDLRVRNVLPCKVVLEAGLEGGKLVCRVVGAQKPTQNITLSSQIIRTQRGGRPALVARLWRRLEAAEGRVSSELISEDVYWP